jgi:serine/threonine-protein kinase HipA
MQCTIEIFINGRWIDCCEISVPENSPGGSARSVFTYDTDYAFSEEAAASLLLPVSVEPKTLKNWPSFLYDLIPQGKGRRYLLGELKLQDGPDADWPLLCAGAFNPIGRLRIKEAQAFYRQHVDKQNQDMLEAGFDLNTILGREESFIEHLEIHGMLSAGTPGVQGVAPKFLLTKGRDSLWYADGALPDANAAKHFLVKLPRGKDASDIKILRNEAAYMRVAKAMGLHVTELPELHGDMLFVPRFDRKVIADGVERLHQESVASLSGQIGFDGRPSQNDILAALRKYVSDPTWNTVEFLKRDVLNLALGNTDNHARNTAVQILDGGVQLTPLFDFAPMNLDKDGIARSLRWKDAEGREVQSWAKVIALLPFEEAERDEIRTELCAFGAQVEVLEDVMFQAGVDDDIIKARHHSIQKQSEQLHELASGGHGGV